MPNLLRPQGFKNLVLGSKFTASAAYGSGSSYTYRTPSVAETDRTKGIFSACVKRGNAGTAGTDSEFFFGTGLDLNFNTNDHSTTLSFETNGKISSAASTGSGGGAVSVWNVQTDSQFEDFSAWYHVILSIDTNQVVGTDRVEIWVNGIKQPLTFSTTPTLSQDTSLGKTFPHFLGTYGNNGGGGDDFSFDGYMTEARWIPNKSIAAGDYSITDFGSFDANGIWEPAVLDGAIFTTGTNGFYFPDPSDINDASGAGNNFTKVGTVSSHQDVPDLNYCTLNPIIPTTNGVYSNNLRDVISGADTGTQIYHGTVGVNSGKWHFEATTSGTGTSANGFGVGISKQIGKGDSGHGTISAGQVIYDSQLGNIYDWTSGSLNSVAYGATYTSGDRITVEVNYDTNSLVFFKNGVSQGTYNPDVNIGGGDLYYPACGDRTGVASIGYSFAFSENDWTDTATTDYKALSRFNLEKPLGQGKDRTNALLYTGTGAPAAVSGMGFRPSVVFIKNRDAVSDWVVTDLVRGTTQELKFNANSAEATAVNGLTSFDIDGFTVGNGGDYNTLNNNYIAYGLKGGSSTVANTNGTINSTVSVSDAANFAVVTYTGNGVNGATVGHGLSFKPDLIIVKSRSLAATDWVTYNSISGATKYIVLNSASTEVASSTTWNDTEPTSTVFSVGTSSSVNTLNETYVAYCISNFSGAVKIGEYEGNGLANGPMINVGFQPRFIIFKSKTTAQGWRIEDSSRVRYNDGDKATLLLNSSAAEAATLSQEVEFHSDGFKIAETSGDVNTSGAAYMYIAVGDIVGGGTSTTLPAFGYSRTGDGTTGTPVTESYVLRNDGSFVLRNDGSKIIRNN